MSEEKKNMSIRLPQQIRAWLAQQAEQNGRSVSGEVAFRMKRMMETERGDAKAHA